MRTSDLVERLRREEAGEEPLDEEDLEFISPHIPGRSDREAGD